MTYCLTSLVHRNLQTGAQLYIMYVLFLSNVYLYLFYISLFGEFFFSLSFIFLQVNPVILHRGHLVSNKRHHPSDINHSIPESYAHLYNQSLGIAKKFNMSN